MFESYKLKKAKAKLEINEVKKQLNEIEAQKEKERWDRMPLWERNIKTEMLLAKYSVPKNKEHTPKYSAIMAGIWLVIISGGVILIGDAIIWTMPPSPPHSPYITHSYATIAFSSMFNSSGFKVAFGVIDLLIAIFAYIEIYYIYRRGYGHY
ncbi:MAG: hypothetical protein EVJ47_03130 [Candidatus Acidulodesulfobacterium ferriphilum]|uniref:Uncharacterized protein n=1 Tax=Candidatus Acidulodesulfobacterium ferriphilum TaxID=2597223 RepID=A0A519BDF8_9DELT|nr:MAG: hypothetical protein EVJ47_03130 [Candidatus Acidulodesulfobacterium ferriphilum]